MDERSLVNQKNKIIIGIDPGSRKTGWGIIKSQNNGRDLEVLDYGVIFLNCDKDLFFRLTQLSLELKKILKKYKPNLCAIEDVFFSKNVRSALILGQARGAVASTVGCEKIEILSQTPAEIKQNIVGNGRASKEQVGQMIKLILKLKEVPFEDAADALACAVSVSKNSIRNNLNIKTKPKFNSKSKGFEALARAQGKM